MKNNITLTAHRGYRQLYPENTMIAFRLMGIRPCVYYSRNTNEEDYKKALGYGAEGFTRDDPKTCGEILDKLGARPLKK